ncbi:Ger(x)C family spore germination C-terminal domain-containing protein [Clostridium estertheticum]|uniref:Ger(x)C family spore germination C-terminal domain-containing protein n=1 Tax=Clostridium estertheticum TaxID=238834 RepID=UPI001C6E02F2|nr:Ger(x)C family spore germination C-terminal domain-containing protein [Clostridium estertheticum]MBW9154072.1 Ger(x)C family spore germination C-terminal domain-containing protein [Clostridium estertheticum]WLC86272.1 Ger(x)C family spore germination C-terminal domain-containing protein [Clostridium estertheticum]
MFNKIHIHCISSCQVSYFISKNKCQYKTDILDLGRIAVAKYGRSKGTDWDKVISNSDIKVNVKFTVDTQGRGSF